MTNGEQPQEGLDKRNDLDYAMHVVEWALGRERTTFGAQQLYDYTPQLVRAIKRMQQWLKNVEELGDTCHDSPGASWSAGVLASRSAVKEELKSILQKP